MHNANHFRSLVHLITSPRPDTHTAAAACVAKNPACTSRQTITKTITALPHCLCDSTRSVPYAPPSNAWLWVTASCISACDGLAAHRGRERQLLSRYRTWASLCSGVRWSRVAGSPSPAPHYMQTPSGAWHDRICRELVLVEIGAAVRNSLRFGWVS
ncbi:hypothetical protein E2C01_046895 [Portunus trituberculatus]|uniref:Uncharacterized protein n=1 Tax=Portunus trituberculatus TaxID=210409 RepID=A0A5B7FZR6_PORTR|nr:hypothetical protein [Portunus trituberculatus]